MLVIPFRRRLDSVLAVSVRRVLGSLSLPLATGIALSALAAPTFAQSSTGTANPSASAGTSSQTTESALPAVAVSAKAAPIDPVAATYGGGQVSKGANFGVLGNQKIIDMPFAVTSYTEKMIEDSQAHTVADVLAGDPNIRSAMGYGNFAQTFTIRGFELAGDDLSLNGLYGLTPRQIVSTDALGRVDLFQGTSAFLNGVSPTGSAVGGGINLELKRAGDVPLTRVTTDFSGSGEVGGHVDVSRRFGSNDQFGIRVNEAAGGGDSAIDRQHGRTGTTAVSLDYRGDKLRLTADFLYQLEKVEEGRSIFYSSGTSLPSVPSATANYAQPWSGSTMEDTVGMLGAEYDFAPGWTAYAKGGMRHTNENGQYASPNYNGTTGAVTEYRLGVPYKQDASSAQVGVRGTFDTGPVSHNLNIGASIVSESTSTAYTFSSTYDTTLVNSPAVPFPATILSGGNLSDPGRIAETVNKGLSISDTMGFFHDRVLFTIGARRQSVSSQSYDYTGVQSATYDQSITTPIFGLVFKLTPNISLYANRSEALTQGGAAPNTAANYGQVFAPYRSKQLEAGVKYDAGSYGANMAVFQIKQPSSYTDVTTNLYTQSGEQRNQGVEFSFYGEPIHGLRFIAGTSFTDAKLTQTAGGTNNGNTAIGVPKWLANIGAEYDIPQVQGLTLTGKWIHTSSQYLDTANTLQIPSWNRFDIGARYTTSVARHKVTIRATVENVANHAYWASTYDGYLTMGDPRTFLLSLSTDF